MKGLSVYKSRRSLDMFYPPSRSRLLREIDSLVESKMYTSAEKKIEEALSLYPDVPKFYGQKIRLLADQGKLREAGSVFNYAVENDILSGFVYYSIMEAYYMHGEDYRVLSLFEEAYMQDYLSSRVCTISLRSAYEIGDKDAIWRIFSISMRENYDTYDIYVSAIEAFYNLGMYNNAIMLYEVSKWNGIYHSRIDAIMKMMGEEADFHKNMPSLYCVIIPPKRYVSDDFKTSNFLSNNLKKQS